MGPKQHYKHKNEQEKKKLKKKMSKKRKSRQTSIKTRNWGKENEVRKMEGHSRHPVSKLYLTISEGPLLSTVNGTQ